MNKRNLLKALAATPVVYTLRAGAQEALGSLKCTADADSYIYEDGIPGLTASCMASVAEGSRSLIG